MKKEQLVSDVSVGTHHISIEVNQLTMFYLYDRKAKT